MKIFLVNREHKADYNVCFVDHPHQERNAQLVTGTIVDKEHKANVKVFIVGREHKADVKIMRGHFI